MPPSTLTPELVAFLEGPNSIVLATQDGNLVPEIARVLLLRCGPGPDRFTLWMNTAASGRTLANLAKDRRIAVSAERPTTHKTLQLKGRVTSLAPAPEEDGAAIEASLRAFIVECQQLGLPPRLLERVAVRPVTRLEIELQTLFEQSPGPGAGEPYAGGGGR